MSAVCPQCSKQYAAGVARCPFCNTPNPDAAQHAAEVMAAAGKQAAKGRGEPRLVEVPLSPVLVALHEESVAQAAEAPPIDPLSATVARFAAWPVERRAKWMILAAAAFTLPDAPILLLDHFPAAGSVSLWLPGFALLAAAALAGLAVGIARARPRRLWIALGVYLAGFALTHDALPIYLVLIQLLPAILLVRLAVQVTAERWVAKPGGE